MFYMEHTGEKSLVWLKGFNKLATYEIDLDLSFIINFSII